MKAENILQADLLDILFENRNKNYGAYSLRKYYDTRIYTALIIVFILMALFSVYISLIKNDNLARVLDVPDPVYAPYEIPFTEKAPEPLPKKKQEQRAAAAVDPDAGRIVLTDTATVINNPLPVPDAGPGTLLPSIGDRKGKMPADTLFVSGSIPYTAPVEITRNKDFPVAADIMPSFPGGMKALEKFLRKNLNNPDNAAITDIVSVKVKFVVGYDGKLREYQVIQDGGKTFNEEVIRVLKKMPQWIPGKAKGENVSVYFIIPVKFVPEE